MRRVLSLLAGLLTGAMVGAGIALLFAPTSGKKIRTDIAGYVGQVERDVRQAAKDKRIELESQLAALRGEIVTE